MNAKRTWLSVAMSFFLLFPLPAAPVRAVDGTTFHRNGTGNGINAGSGAQGIANGTSILLQTTSLSGTDCGAPIAVAAEADSWIDQNSAASNFALAGVLKIQSKSGGDSRALMRFPMPPAPDGCVLGSAQLYVHAVSAFPGRTLGVLSFASDWSEDTVTWNNQPATSGTASTALSDFGIRRWDVTSQVQSMYATGKNHGFLLRDLAENGEGFEQQFVSRENADDGPELLIRFISVIPVDPASPDTLIATAPVELTLLNTASFHFSGSDDTTSALDLSFQCRLDSPREEDFVACASPVGYSQLQSGSHTFEVRAIDRDNKIDLIPAFFTWTILPPGGGTGELTSRQVSCGQILTTNTRVLNNLSECPEDGLVIGAHGIIVDLDDHIVDGVGLGIGIRNDGFDSVTVRNGTVQEFDYGVRLSSGASLNVIESLTVQNNQITGMELLDEGTYGNQVRDDAVANNADGIALLDGSEATLVLDNSLVNNSGLGLYLRASSGNLLGSNSIGVGSNAGIRLEGASENVLLGNTLQSAGDGGILVTLESHDNRLRDNFVSGTSDAGFVVDGSDGNLLIGNTVTGTGDSGFALKDSHGSLLLGNTAYDNSDSGISLDAANDNVLRTNDVRFNPGGIELGGSSRNLIEANEASLTTGNGIEIGPESLENLILLNRANGNSAQGISVGEDAPEGLGNLIEKNTASQNGGGGIHIGKGGSLVRHNITNNNRGWGIYAGDTSVDGGGNLATGNSEPGQCFNVICNAIPTPTSTPSPTPTSPAPATLTPSMTSSATQELASATATQAPDETDQPTDTPTPPTDTETPTGTSEPPAATETGTLEPADTPVLPTATHVPTDTPEPPSATPLPTATLEPTETPEPPTLTVEPSHTPVPPTLTHTFTAMASPTSTPEPTHTQAPTATIEPTETPKPPTPTSSATPEPTHTPQPPTATDTLTSTVEPSATTLPPTATRTLSATVEPSETPLPPTATRTFTATAEPSDTPVPPSATREPTNTRTPTNTPVAPSSTHTATTSATATSTPTSTGTPTLTPSQAQTFTFAPDADATLYSGSPNTNFGFLNAVETDGSPVKNILLKFVVSGIDGRQVTSAKLRLFNTDSSSYGGDFRRAANNIWQEGTVTWNNAPSGDSSILASLGRVDIGTWYEVDLSSWIAADGTYSLRITSPSSAGADYSSREGSNPPQLIINIAGGTTVTSTHTSTPVPPAATHTPTATSEPTNTSIPPNVTPTATSPTDLIFADGFESGNMSAWSAASTDSGDLSVSPVAALVGGQGLQAVLDDNQAVFVTDDRPNAETHYRARFYFDPNTIQMANGNVHNLLNGYAGTSTLVLRLQFRCSNGVYQLRAGLRNDESTWAATAWSPIADAPHVIELYWRASTAAGIDNGGLTLWIDGVQTASVAGVDNDTRRIDRVRLGAVAGMDDGTRGTYYFDAFESRRETYMGP
jgi:parallel beta-helix repeat protein